MSTGDNYEQVLARLRALLDQAIEKGELPSELLPENQHGHTADRSRLQKLRDLAVSGDFAALRELWEESSALTALNRGDMDESSSDEALEAAKENLRKRRSQEREKRSGEEPRTDERR